METTCERFSEERRKAMSAGLRALSPCHRHNLESFKCCRFDVGNTNSVYQYEPVEATKNCVEQAAWFGDSAGWTYCPKNMVLAGMSKDDWYDNWYDVVKIWCCEIPGKKRALRYGSLPAGSTDKKDVAGCSKA